MTIPSLNPPLIQLMGPGPSCVYPEVYRALSAATLGHLDPAFIEIMDETCVLLRKLMGTSNSITFPISGTGSAGMEAAFVNLVEPGDRILICVNGVFGMRMADVAERFGAEVERLDFKWGMPVDPQVVKEKLESSAPFQIVGVVHAETSTGALSDVEAIGSIVKDTKALYIVDAVTSLGGMPVQMDAWQIDVLYSGTQKCLSCPPGLAPFSFSELAVAKLIARRTKVPNWYLDLSMIKNYWEGAKRAYHHTAPINMIYGLNASLKTIMEEGMQNVYSRHMAAHKRLLKGIETLALDFLVQEGSRLPMLNTVKVPECIDEAALRVTLRNNYRIEIGAGLGPLAGKVWRIGLMGHTARDSNVDSFLEAFASILNKQAAPN